MQQEENIEARDVEQKVRKGNPFYNSPNISRAEFNLIKAFFYAAALWLLIGSLAGELNALKFIWPGLMDASWLTFGRIRPIHTNTLFWGWSSLAMLGLAYYVVPSSAKAKLYSVKLGWITFWLINISVIAGSITMFFGFNNGMGEYREFIWPIMGTFILALAVSTYNFYVTIHRREENEMYVSNWFIMGSLLWSLTFMIIGYLPFYQNALGETVIQGYYMHNAVGMWFMTFTLGLVYYFLPKMLNTPIYSHSLGIVAFWTQLLFYTLIGTHHFLFSPLPWWIQAQAIIFSVGMMIPVVASTTNFSLTLRGHGKTIRKLPGMKFMLVGIIFYFLGSFQGSLQAIQSLNIIWHFTDFTIAHSHMTMYTIITFLLWGMIYGFGPKISGRFADKKWVDIHFWLAFVGLLIYSISLMIGGTKRGISWLDGQPFIDSVILMVPYWTWRAVGGTMMFLSHFVFGWNLYQMLKSPIKNIEYETI
ncbi:MAG: cbb3-type cytochrome c oxidase subunit I [Dysgonamonadaceae bacterium]|jgi:cytochrome c oxidase cbb3-type subunit 1|nr:cbb3-type cytochrome c oxidase subunit I [Dysgonamonadaceae bacterium]MDD3356358.1 cbb3-type cytochrome c oxidase subunit I [Dysgonamonadaceae bacterium]MDD3727398.1 cbb3-type cytochrome c oxidase subunit I [Dysgonamonadaceae bacterium]MDD4246281.1 cbb3-type cytochrome c oxidase subunit I [Dysgonamonadaceae bacterium]MDD4605343.1 cbb3-type cytochrome c oxidase subunit I [Dysgonamonadaceae bacterium]